MAQWNGQYTGNTHSTKVEDLEAALRHAVVIFREVRTSEEIAVKGKAVYKLATKLLAARLKLLKAKIYDVEPVVEKGAKSQNATLELFRQQEMNLRFEGVNVILKEFEVQDLVV